MNKKTILYVRTDIYNKKLIAGGSVTHTIGVIEGFIAHGYSVVCASSVMLEHLERCALTALQPLQNPKIFSFLRWKINCLLSNIFFTYTIFQFSKKYSLDFIYQRSGMLNCSGLIVSKFRKIPLILEYNGSEVWLEKYCSSQKWFKGTYFIGMWEALTLRRADYVIVVSQALKGELISRKVNAHKILVNPNGVNTQIFDPKVLENHRSRIRNELHLNDKFVFGFVGTFSIWHGIEVLAKIAPLIIERHPEAHFIFIGDGPLLDFLKQELTKAHVTDASVTYTGLLPAHESKQYLAVCDAFLSPNQPNSDDSRFFGSPTKLFEYLSMGKPIIASNMEQITEIVSPAYIFNGAVQEFDLEPVDKHVGYVINPGNEIGFVHTASHLIKMPVLDRLKMGDNARARAVDKYGWHEHVNKIISFVTENSLSKGVTHDFAAM